MKIMLGALSGLSAVGLLVAGTHAQELEPCVIGDGGRLKIGSEQSCIMPADLAASPFSLTEMTIEDDATLVLPARADNSTNHWNFRVLEARIGNNVLIHARGKDGPGGHSGRSGQNGNTCYHGGSPGAMGGAGGSGAPGQDITLEINFVALGSLTVDVTGGKGGAGGQGGTGGRAGVVSHAI